MATIDFVKRKNDLNLEERDHREWQYIIIDDKTFKAMKSKGAGANDIFEYTKITKSRIDGTLFEK